MNPRLKEKYNKDVLPRMMKAFNYKNRMGVPRLEKIVINMGVGEATENAKALDQAASDLTIISGQKPAITRARKSVSGFKLREGVPIGCKVTLRGSRMYEFFDRLVNTALPRVRDFRGVNPKSFDGRGNYSLGIVEQLIFPEIAYDEVEKLRGMDITVVTSAKSTEEARELLKLLGLPLQSPEEGRQKKNG